MTAHRALVAVTPTAARAGQSGASLRVDDVVELLEATGFDADVTPYPQVRDAGAGSWCLGVAVSYASASALRPLRRRAPVLWLDVMDSWLTVNGSGVAAGHPAYAARFARDALRIAAAPRVDLATYISDRDRRADRATVAARRRLVLAGRSMAVELLPAAAPGGRVVLAGDWDYAPNRDGLDWLSQHVLPLLPDVAVHVYGPGRLPAAPAQVVQHGYVADERELYREGDVHLAPVRFGGGVKRKVLTPLLAGLAVVARPAATQGLRQHPLLDVADTGAAFAAAVRRRLAESRKAVPPRPEELYDADESGLVRDWLLDVACAHRRHQRPS
jgi:hypothetical protein